MPGTLRNFLLLTKNTVEQFLKFLVTLLASSNRVDKSDTPILKNSSSHRLCRAQVSGEGAPCERLPRGARGTGGLEARSGGRRAQAGRRAHAKRRRSREQTPNRTRADSDVRQQHPTPD